MNGAKLNTDVTISPKGSQVVLVGMITLAGISLILSSSLIYFQLDFWWVFLVFSSLCCVGALWAWRCSNDNLDLASAHPATITVPNTAIISADTRTLRDPQSVNSLVIILQETLSRKPLPLPSGLVGSDMELMSNSEEQAKQVVDEINAESLATTNMIYDSLGLSFNEIKVPQEVHKTITPDSKVLP
jgi:hypothetical protein